MRKRKNIGFRFKSGNAFLDMMMVLFVLLGLAIASLVGYKIFGDINTSIQSDDTLNNQSKAITGDLYNRYPSFMDGAFVFVVGLLWVFVLVSSALIDSHPMFFIVSLILLIFAFIVVMLLSNTFEEISTDTEFGTTINSFPMTNFIMTHLLTVFIVMGSSILIMLYGKNKFMGG